MAKETQVICRNIFKTSTKADTKKEFTKCWIELIDQREKNKGRAVSN